MNYCEKCNSIVTMEYCPACGNKKIREVTSDDFCFLVECAQMHGEMLNDALQEEAIQCALIPCGNGVRSKFALNLENYRVYVPYRHYERAKIIFNTLFNESDNIKELLLTNKDRWNIANERAENNIRQRLKIDNDVDIFEYIKEGVEKSQNVKNRGVMYTFLSEANWLTVKIGDVTLWFPDESFEIRL